MKKISILALLLVLLLLSSCKTKDPFKLRAELGNYHAEITYEFYNSQGYAGKSTGNEDYDKDKDIVYRNLDGLTGKQKMYLAPSYTYEYNFSEKQWEKSKTNYEDSGDFNDYKSKENYDYIDGKYVLKSSIDLGQVLLYEMYVEKGYLVIRKKVSYGNIWTIETRKFITLDDKNYSITLPTNYVNK